MPLKNLEDKLCDRSVCPVLGSTQLPGAGGGVRKGSAERTIEQVLQISGLKKATTINIVKKLFQSIPNTTFPTKKKKNSPYSGR